MYDFRAAYGPVEVAFTDAGIDLKESTPGFEETLAGLVADTGVPFARMNQVHGDGVALVREPHRGAREEIPTADALVTDRPGLGLMVRVADCVPVILAGTDSDADAGVVGAVHAGRKGVVLDVVTRTVERMRELGAGELQAWVGPHVCGRCYEVPEEMRTEVASQVPSARAETSWGTPALDLGAAVHAQLDAAGVKVEQVGGCTRESERYHSHRRDGAASGRMAGLVWRR